VAFVPSALGLREAVVSVSNSDADKDPYTFDIQGTGDNYLVFIPLVFR
jgi:hypothetical protein